MKVQAIIDAATAEGLVVDLSQNGSLKAIGEQEVVDRWRPVLTQHKAEIINLLSREPGGAIEATRALPHWCRIDCPGLERIPLPNEGEVAGCVHPVTGTWRRLDWLTGCPALEQAARSTVPDWCNTKCKHFHRTDVPQIGTLLWCCQEEDSTHWRRHRIDSMNECPIATQKR